MNGYAVLVRHVLAPGMDLLRGTHTMRCLQDLETSQWWPLERIERLQSERLQKLIRYAYERVPYYHRLMDSRSIPPDAIRTTADLAKLPVLSKAEVREHTGELVAEGFPVTQLLNGRTGGSTGTPLAFYSSREGRWTHGMARSIRALQWAGVHLGERTVRVIKRRPAGGAEEAPFERISHVLTREAFEDCAAFSDSSLPLVIDRISKLQPRALRGYTSAICILAQFIRDSGTVAPRVGAVVVGGEQLFDEQRTLLRETFGNEPFSRYSSFENFDIAMECKAHQGMHIAAEDLVVEIVDDDGRPVPLGQEGHILVTNLHEHGMPLIRYDTDDSGSFFQGQCSCGRALPRLSAVCGKTGNTIYTPSGKRLSPLTLGSSGLAPLGIRQFQFIQEELDRVVVKVVPGSILSPQEAGTLSARLTAHYAKTLGDDVRIDVVFVPYIGPTPAGKHLFLISKVQPPRRPRASGGAA